MRYAPEHNELTRARIVDGASRLFRERGVAAVGLARVMEEAGLTVGTFYNHFESKEALLQAVLAHAQRARDVELTEAVRGGHLEFVVRAYLSPAHRDAPATGCVVAALGAEVARHPRATRDTFTDALAPTIDLLQQLLGNSRADATAFLGLLSGTLNLARATADEATSNDILDAGIRAALVIAGRPAALEAAPLQS